MAQTRFQRRGSQGDDAAEVKPVADKPAVSKSDFVTGRDCELVIVLCTFPSAEEVGEIAYTLLSERLCACVSIVRETLSIYRWNDEVVSNKEVLCMIKTQRSRHGDLVHRLGELHPYDVPEIVTLSPSAVNIPYLSWVKDETDPSPPSGIPSSGLAD